jgi:transposase
MAHAQRRFEHAKDQDKRRSDEMMNMFCALYYVEQKAREQALEHDQRKALRMRELLPILQAMEQWMKENLQMVLPKSDIGETITYTLGQWKWLLRYLEDGRYEIDNNLIENTIRPIALGRKNYLPAKWQAGLQDLMRLPVELQSFTAFLEVENSMAFILQNC